MKSNKFVSLFLGGFSVLTFLAFVGATTGTLAWYAYSTRATLAYKGVSVDKTAQMQIGIVDDPVHPRILFTDSELAENNCVRDSSGIVWANVGSGINSRIISGYLSGTTASSYVNELLPITTKERALDSVDALSLYNAPRPGHAENNVPAENKSYISIPFAFRVMDNEGHYMSNTNVWMKRADVSAVMGAYDISPAIRVFTEDPNDLSRRFLVNPSSEEHDGSTTVAGLLDLDGNNYYDYNFDDPYGIRRELVYGSYGPAPATQPAYSGELADDTGFDDVNHTNITDPYIRENSSFIAKHQAGNRMVTNFDDLELYTADYYGMNGMSPTLDAGTGHFTGGNVITSTLDDANKIAYLNINIFLEGWDHSVIDLAIGCRFNLGLTFEIDRV